MKWLLSIVFAVLVTLFWADFAPVYKSLVYAQSSPTDASTSVVEDENDGEQKASKKIEACDIFGYRWKFTIKKNGTIKGEVDTGNCGNWKVSGTYDKATKAITLTAKNQDTGNGCCTAFTYTGTFNKKTKVGSGSWTNECGGSGSWTMSKCQ